MKILKNKGKIIKKNTVNKLVSVPNDHQTTILDVFISSIIQFDKFFLFSGLIRNYLIYIFMNIDKKHINKGKIIKKNIINKLILASNHHQTSIVACFIS